MKQAISIFAFSAVALAASGCIGNNALDPFVEQAVNVKSITVTGADAASGIGELNFRHTRYWTSYRNVCDTAVCGYDEVYRCHTHTRCDALADVIAHDPGPSHPRGNGGSGSHGTGDHNGGGGGSWGGGGGYHEPHHDTCHSYETCGYQSEPRYCQVNCREEPYTDSATDRIKSAVSVQLRVHGRAISGKDLLSIHLGVKTNLRFQAALANPGSVKKELRPLLATLTNSDRTLLVLRAKGLRLVQNQSFLNLPASFTAGQPVVIAVDVEPTGSSETEISVIATPADFPPLEWSSRD